MIENVKGLIQKNFIDDFYDIVNEIESMGYTCYYPTKEDKKGNKNPMCLNAKNYGIPQNRERIFIICVRKDVDNGTFKFWQGKDFGIRLKDILEDKVDEKYYLSEEVQKRFKLNGNEDLEHNELNIVGSSAPDFRTIGQRDMTYGINGIMSTLTATDYKQPKQIIDNKQSNICRQLCNVNPSNEGMSGRIYDSKNIAPTLDTTIKKVLDKEFRIRKLTPTECWRLMGFRDEHIQKAMELGTSDTQLYKQAGNSIVVNCLYYIFKELFKEYIVE